MTSIIRRQTALAVKYSKELANYTAVVSAFRLKSYKYSHGKCVYCERVVAWDVWTVDHKIPISRGGDSNLHNLVGCCFNCNQAKGNLTVEEFLLTPQEQHVALQFKFTNTLYTKSRRKPNDIICSIFANAANGTKLLRSNDPDNLIKVADVTSRLRPLAKVASTMNLLTLEQQVAIHELIERLALRLDAI